MATFLLKLVAGSMLVTSSALSAALAQSTQPSHPVFVAAEYTSVRTNIAPGCSCFSLNGGSVQALVSISGHLDAIADVTLGRQAGITPDGYALTQLSYTFGVRYLPTDRGARSPTLCRGEARRSKRVRNSFPTNNRLRRIECLRSRSGRRMAGSPAAAPLRCPFGGELSAHKVQQRSG